VLVLTSGGADSTCLLGVLARIHDGPLLALAIDHGLRPEAAAECDLAEESATRVGVPALRRRLALAPGPGMQERAREARLAAAARTADEHECAVIATGHTASDQAETVLFRMARGTGRSGALGMAARRGRLVRPLLGEARADTRAWCEAAGLAYADDPTNDDAAGARARVRHGLLPALLAVHPAAERHVAALADDLADEAELIDGLLEAAWARAGGPGGLDAAALAAEPPALGGEARSRAPVERVLSLARGERGATLDVPGGAVLLREGRLTARAGGERVPAGAA
jgi:tRNA(Ile)-lysidine synthase